MNVISFFILSFYLLSRSLNRQQHSPYRACVNTILTCTLYVNIIKHFLYVRGMYDFCYSSHYYYRES